MENSAQEQKFKKAKGVIDTLLIIAKELFIFSLIFYLILFILETVFPGFVSNNFDLNYALVAVVGLGFLAALAPEQPETGEKKDKPKITDYLISIFLGLLGGILMFYRLPLALVPRAITATICTLFIVGISLVLLLVEDKEIEEREEKIETFVGDTFLSRKTLTTPIAFLRLLLFRKINFPVILLVMAFLFVGLSLPPKTGYQPRKINLPEIVSKLSGGKTEEESPETKTALPSPTPTPKKVIPSTELLIKILDGGATDKVTTEFTKTLKSAGFAKVFYGQADRKDYKNALIRFRSQDENQAMLIKDLLETNYKTIEGQPSSTDSAEITVILGTPATE